MFFFPNCDNAHEFLLIKVPQIVLPKVGSVLCYAAIIELDLLFSVT